MGFNARPWSVVRAKRDGSDKPPLAPIPARTPATHLRAGYCSNHPGSNAQVAADDPRFEVIRFTDDENITDMARQMHVFWLSFGGGG